MKRAVLWLAGILVALPAFSQFSVKGVVVDEENRSLPGASILLVEQGRGLVTSRNGAFVLEGVQGGSRILQITFVGYEPWSTVLNMNADRDLGMIRMTRAAILGEEVIITATRAGGQTPVAVSNIEKGEIKTRNFGQDMPYLLSSTPSLVTSSDAGNGIGYTSMRIRGTDANRINVTVNGIPLNDAESHSVYWVDLPDLATSVDNIQIQRGVGTSTNGAAAFGASINLQTQKLEKEAYGLYEGTFGSFRTLRNSISAGSGLIHDHFSVDLRLSELHSDGYIDRSWTNLKSYYVSTGYNDSRTLVKFITFGGTEELYQAWNGVPSDMLETNRRYNGLGAYSDAAGRLAYYDNQIDHYRQMHYQLHLSRVFTTRLYANAALHYTGGAGYYEQYKEDESLSDYRMEDVILGGDTIRSTDLIRRKWLDNDFYGAVGGIHYRGGRIGAVLGGGWNRYVGDHLGRVIWARYPGTSEIRYQWYDNRGIKSDWNSYLKTTFEGGDRLLFFADMQLRGIDYSISGIDDDLRDIAQEHDFLFFNPKAGFSFQVSPAQRFYIFVARASREPNRNNFVDADPAGPVPRKETLLDYETGYSFAGAGYSLNLNFYYMDYTDQLVLTGEINDVGSAIMTNVKDSYRTGLEISGSLSPVRWLRWNLNVTLSRNRIIQYRGYVDNWDYWSDPVNLPYQVEENRGNTDLAFSPGIIVHSNLDVEPVKHLHLNLSSRYVGKQYIDNTSSEERILDPYLVSDLRIAYTFYPRYIDEAAVQFQVMNLFNTEYETNAWIYRYYSGGKERTMDGYYPQAGTHFMLGIRLKL